MHADVQTLDAPILVLVGEHDLNCTEAAARDTTLRWYQMECVSRALGARDAAQGLFDLAVELDVPLSLEALGVQSADLDRVTEAALAAPYPNPRPLERAAIRALLEDAYRGRRPCPASAADQPPAMSG